MKTLALIFLAIPFTVRAEFDPSKSPFADKSCDSYANHRDASGSPAVLRWGEAPFGDFGSRVISFDHSGVRKLRQSPPAGVHPRIFFGPDELADVRKRVRETRCGQETWKNILSWTEMMKGRYDDTPDQRKLMHAELAETTWSHDNYGTFNSAESSRSNWATFSYWLIQVLAIEGEPGFNGLKVRGMYRCWRNLLTYGWFESGATFEGEAKNQLGMDGVIAFVTRRSRTSGSMSSGPTTAGSCGSI